jgi:hypothetical protein
MQVGALQQINGMGDHGGIRDIVQPLSQDDRIALQTQMRGLPSEDRKSAIESMKEIDSKSLSSANYLQSLLNAIAAAAPKEGRSIKLFSVYA